MKYLIIIILAIVTLIFINVHYSEKYKIIGKVYDKSMTSVSGGGNSYYHVLIVYEDGETEDLSGVNNYINYEKGRSYLFTKYRLNFDKK